MRRIGLVAFAVLLPSAGEAQQQRRRLDLSEPLTYFIAEGPPESGVKPADRMLALWAIEAWAGLADDPPELEPASEDAAVLRVYWVGAAGGLYGEMRPREVDGRIGADVFVHPDTESLGPAIASAGRRDPLFRDTIVYLTCVHELGHAFGLRHTDAFADIMYSFQFGGDFVAYFMRFRDELGRWEDIRGTDPFSAGDVGAFGTLYGRS